MNSTEPISHPIYPYPVHSQKVLFDALSIAYMDLGPQNAPCIFFIHGLGHASIAWQHNIKQLSQQYRCIAVDIPGNGLSDKDIMFPYSLEFFSKALIDLMKKLNIGPVFLCGHSMGGQICFNIAHLAPELVKGMILCAPAGIEQFTLVERQLYKNTMLFVDMLSSEENSLRKAVHNSFYLLPQSGIELAKELVALMHLQDRAHYRFMIERCIFGMLEEPVYQHFNTIKQPIQIIFGERDSLIPNKIMHPMSLKDMLLQATSILPNANFEMLPQCGHFVQWEKARQVNDIINSFVREQIIS